MATPTQKGLQLDVEAGGVLPSQARPGLRITLKDLTYTVDSHTEKNKKASLLQSVTAYAEPFQMTALMGPSGSGKTTLLDVLAGRKTTGSVNGVIKFGNATPSPAFLRRYTGYVEQFDTLIGSLTVTEMLMYTAELKRSISESHSSKAQAVADLIERLGLTSCAHVKIGDPLTKGISGGQAKRTNIGIALISDPKVLFLDEPTSGLDSYSSNEVISLVQGLSREGTTVVATIHQPSAQAFAMFDQVLLLVRGRTAYFGPLGDATEYAQQHWPAAKTPRLDCSLPEFLVDIVTEADRSGQADMLAMAYSTSQLRKDNEARVADYLSYSSTTSKSSRHHKLLTSSDPLPQVVVKDDDQSSDSSRAPDTAKGERGSAGPLRISNTSRSLSTPDLDAALATRNATSTPWWWALLVLLKYRATVNYKNPAWFMPRIADKFLFSFVILTLYLKTGDQFDEDNLINLGASLFMWTCLPAFGAVAYVPSIVLERSLFYRERADGLYYVGTYYVAKLVEELFLAFIISIGFSAFVFYGVQYQGSFALFWLVYLLVLSIGIVLGYLVAAIAPNMDVANAMLPAYVTTLLFFAGQLATYDSMPRYWQWYSRIDFLRYSWTALMTNQFADNNPPFSAGAVSILEYYGMHGAKPWVNFSYLFAFFAVFATLGYLGLSYVRHSKR